MTRPVRVRFAPSPTGPLHIGGVRTALYNYLFARRHGGKMILRIEDTDSQRFVPGAEAYIIESLEWCGIHIDEGVGQGGPHAPYRQSERREIYLKYALQLVDAGWAYYAFDTADELNALRAQYEERGETFAYNASVRERLATSLALPADEVRARIERGDQWVVRFKMPADETVRMHDLIRGDVEVNTSTLDDKVLYKSADALPTYHLANIVDDHLMEITHVIRGEEWLPSLPLHYLLYRAFGWEATQPEFAHLPLLLKPTGGGKLSKRDGDKMGFPVFPLFWQSPTGETAHGYREDGYFPEAFINMLALLGWNPGTEQELFSMQELIDAFSLERVSKSGARFQPDKAKWFNAQYMHRKSDAELAALYQPILRAHGIEVTDEVAGRAAGIMKERATFITDLWELTSFFFVAPTQYEEKQVRKYWKGENPDRLREVREVLASIDDFSLENTERIVHAWIEQKGYPMGQIMNTLRLALVGAGKGPGMYDVTSFIGKEEPQTGRIVEIEQYLWGASAEGEGILLYTLRCAGGREVRLSNAGAAVTGIFAAGADGRPEALTPVFETPEALLADYADRGKTLCANRYGFGQRIWQSRVETDRIVMELPAGDDGLPALAVLFDLDDDGQFAGTLHDDHATLLAGRLAVDAPHAGGARNGRRTFLSRRGVAAEHSGRSGTPRRSRSGPHDRDPHVAARNPHRPARRPARPAVRRQPSRTARRRNPLLPKRRLPVLNARSLPRKPHPRRMRFFHSVRTRKSENGFEKIGIQ